MKNYVKLLKRARLIIAGVASLGLDWGLCAQSIDNQVNTRWMLPISKGDLPIHGTFWLLKGPTGSGGPPYPCLPYAMEAPVYQMENGQFLIDDSGVDYGIGTTAGGTANGGTSTSSVPDPADGGFGDGDPTPPPPDISNYAKYLAHSFTVLNTNQISIDDSNLYGIIVSMPSGTSNGPNLQIAAYGTNAVIIKANHFDYSQESRDFALIICDNPEAPIWKAVDVVAPNSQDGWLVQGTVPPMEVKDPMWMMVSNVNPGYPGFFKAIPYAGPQIRLACPQEYESVSNTVTIVATVSDLSGVANDRIDLTVDGYAARYSIAASNTISIDTRYSVNGYATIFVTAYNTSARAFSTNSVPTDAKLSFFTITNLALDFENQTFVAFQSDMCSPDVGTNYIVFSIDQARQISATIKNPSTGQTLASYSGYVPSAANVALAWDFTMADGVTPYAGNDYSVSFSATGSSTLMVTNTVDRDGVRAGAGTFMTYLWEDPHYTNPDGQWLNSQADTWVAGTLTTLYNDLYNQLGLTQYYPWMVGSGRNRGGCYPRNAWSGGWDNILFYLTNSYFSELTLGPAHGSGAEIGSTGSYLPGTFNPMDLKRYIVAVGGANWRMRKANIWTCYSGDVRLATGGVYNTSWVDACGIRPKGLQEVSYMRKNCGLFIGGKINQRGFAGGDGSISTAKVEELCDQIWVCGQNMYAGGCDPTYSFEFAVNATRGMFNPELDDSNPLLAGYKYMIYASVYDDMLMVLNTSFVHP